MATPPPSAGRSRSQRLCRETLERKMADWIREAPENRLDRDGADHIFDAPIVGIADGNDPIFEHFREVVSPRHRLPREWLTGLTAAPRVRVMVWILPFSEAVRASNRGTDWPSALYSLSRNNGAALDLVLSRKLADELQAVGHHAAIPILSEGYDVFRTPDRTFSSTWSQRHAAYAAGLGRFGLNQALITARGICVRIGSLVTDAPLETGPARDPSWRAPCLASGGGVCDQCRHRCPIHAISGAGLEKLRCYEMRQAVRRRSLDNYVHDLPMIPIPVTKSGHTKMHFSLGCALCQCGVPCEAQDPFAKV